MASRFTFGVVSTTSPTLTVALDGDLTASVPARYYGADSLSEGDRVRVQLDTPPVPPTVLAVLT